MRGEADVCLVNTRTSTQTLPSYADQTYQTYQVKLSRTDPNFVDIRFGTGRQANRHWDWD